MKKRLLIYSDCYIFGGSELLLACIILNPIIKENFEIHYAYRHHAVYEKGLQQKYGKNRENFHPLRILANDTLFHKINSFNIPKIIRNLLKLPWWCLQKTGIYFLYNYFTMKVFIRKIKPQIVHINNGGYPGAKTCSTFVLAAKSEKVNNILYQVNNIAALNESKFVSWVDKNFIEKNVKNFITASKKSKEALYNNRGFALSKIIQLPNTILDSNISVSRKEILKRYSLPESTYLICQCAFLSKRKGHIYLLDAIKKIRLSDPVLFKKLIVMLVGDGEEELSLKKFVRDNDLIDKVIFAGYQPDSINFISACDVFVLPSISSEDMPLVILEAMNKSKTIIATNFAGIQEELENGVSGILVELDIKTLSENLSRAIGLCHTENQAFYGLNAKKRFDDLFSLNRYGKQLLKIYQSLNSNQVI